MPMSHVASILEVGGGHRFVVGSLESIKENTQRRERAFVVPDYLVWEPMPYESWGVVLGTAYRHMKASLDAESPCGGCRACCKTMPIAEIGKHSHVLCPMSNGLVGCTIHRKGKPKSCKAFECMWLVSQRRNDRMEPELRPDRCGVIFTADTSQHAGGTFDSTRIEAHEDHDTGVTNPEAVQKFVGEMSAAGYWFDKITHYYGEKS